MVNHAYKYDAGDGKGDYKEHMHAPVYHEGVGKKGANNIVPLIMKTLSGLFILRENNRGGELVVVCNN